MIKVGKYIRTEKMKKEQSQRLKGKHHSPKTEFKKAEVSNSKHPCWIKGITKKFLIKEYSKKEKPMQAIANKMGCSRNVIAKRLRYYNITIRKWSEKTPNFGKKIIGSKNGMFGKNPWNKNRTGVYTKATLDKMSKSFSGINHPFYGKKRPEISGKNCYLYGKTIKPSWGKFKGINMRSSYEIVFAQFLSLSGIEWSYESKRFYLGDTTYTPDFYLPKFDCYIEIKGYWRKDAKEKFKLFKKYCPRINIKILNQEKLIKLGVL